jgi:hypothetical protein
VAIAAGADIVKFVVTGTSRGLFERHLLLPDDVFTVSIQSLHRNTIWEVSLTQQDDKYSTEVAREVVIAV